MPTYQIAELPLTAAVTLARISTADDPRWAPVIAAAEAWLRGRTVVTITAEGALFGATPDDPVTARVAARLVVRAAETQAAIVEAARRRRLFDAIAAARRQLQEARRG
jgi:hypothetical protein